VLLRGGYWLFVFQGKGRSVRGFQSVHCITTTSSADSLRYRPGKSKRVTNLRFRSSVKPCDECTPIIILDASQYILQEYPRMQTPNKKT
jgi:hypothetical protein